MKHLLLTIGLALTLLIGCFSAITASPVVGVGNAVAGDIWGNTNQPHRSTFESQPSYHPGANPASSAEHNAGYRGADLPPSDYYSPDRRAREYYQDRAVPPPVYQHVNPQGDYGPASGYTRTSEPLRAKEPYCDRYGCMK